MSLFFFIFHYFFFQPYGIQERIGNSLLLKYEYQTALEFLKANFNQAKHTLIISNQPNLYVIQNYNAVDFAFANSNIEKLQGDYYHDHILVFQRYDHKKLIVGNAIDPSLTLKPLASFNMSNKTVLKISEMVRQ